MIRAAVVRAFVGYELRDLRSNPRVWPLLLIFPVLGVGFCVVIAALGPALMEEATRDPGVAAMLRQAVSLNDLQAYPMEEALTRYILRALAGFFLLMPVAIASTAAAFSVVGEKQQRTLEPILATPITDREFLAAKFAVCMAPTVGVTWAAGLVAVAGVDLVSWLRLQTLFLPDRYWLVGVGLLSPLLAAGITLVTMRLSARSVDPQATVQASALVILPGFLLVFGVFGKLLLSSFPALLVAAGLMVVIDLWLFRRVERTFRREEILTKWK